LQTDSIDKEDEADDVDLFRHSEPFVECAERDADEQYCRDAETESKNADLTEQEADTDHSEEQQQLVRCQ
jgi:hypothetical protein